MALSEQTSRRPITPDFGDSLKRMGLPGLYRAPLQALQINLGRLCNQACEHCHVDAGPKRTEIMSWETMQNILHWCSQNKVKTVDLTGGAPEMNPHFRPFVDGLLALDISVMSRCNLTILMEPGYEDLIDWYAERKIALVASLPCYTRENVDAQRGRGVFDKSIKALKQLNAVGYGIDDELPLDLVYNPVGAALPGAQATLEQDYKVRLGDAFGIRFHHLLALANLPINRFAHMLERTGQSESYQQLLYDNFNPQTVDGLMCRHLLSIDWLGQVFDCDFNQMLAIKAGFAAGRPLWQIKAEEFSNAPIAIADHCYGCTAGAGSSCGGALDA